MTAREFDSLATKMFGDILIPLGFTNQRTNRCTFYRKVSNDVFHFIMPDVGSRGAWYDVRVFPHSPSIDPLFERDFPDNLGIPTDRYSLLSKGGVGPVQGQFNCKNVDNFRNGFARTVGPLLVKVAIPYLDQFGTVADMIPVVRHSSFLGFALHQVGRREEALVALERERERLRTLDTTNQDVMIVLEHLEGLLSRMTK